MTTVMESCPRKGPALDGKLQGQAPSWELRPLHRVGLQANSSALNGWRIHCCRKIISAGDVCLRVRCVHLEGVCQRNYFSVSVPHWETGRNSRLR